MNLSSFNPEGNRDYRGLTIENDVLSGFKKKEHTKEIRLGMSPVDIAEVVSDHLIEIVRERFNARNEPDELGDGK